jgi:hypothetical protein
MLSVNFIGSTGKRIALEERAQFIQNPQPVGLSINQFE